MFDVYDADDYEYQQELLTDYPEELRYKHDEEPLVVLLDEF